jgi:hypothetical protein
MGGTLDLASTPQQGSTFWVELPLVEGPVQRDERSGQAEPGAEEPAEHSGPTLTVLYIEDNLSNLRLSATPGPGSSSGCSSRGRAAS